MDHARPTSSLAGGQGGNAKLFTSAAQKKVKIKGGRYDGDTKEGKRHGRGKYSYSNGQQYYGDWRDDMRSGKGEEIWPDGRVYFGEWRKDAFHGKGTFTWADGTVFNGTFRNYCPLEGELVSADRSLVYHVVYDGETPIFGGQHPSPISSKLLEDASYEQGRGEAEHALINSKSFIDLLTSKLREQMQRNPGGEALEIDDVEGLEGVKISFDIKRRSTEMARQFPTTRDAERRRSQEGRRSQDGRRSGDISDAAFGAGVGGARGGDNRRGSSELRRSVELTRAESGTTGRRRSGEMVRQEMAQGQKGTEFSARR